MAVSPDRARIGTDNPPSDMGVAPQGTIQLQGGCRRYVDAGALTSSHTNILADGTAI
jgi:hypothetical protein